jgi:hypothetical protein
LCLNPAFAGQLNPVCAVYMPILETLRRLHKIGLPPIGLRIVPLRGV